MMLPDVVEAIMSCVMLSAPQLPSECFSIPWCLQLLLKAFYTPPGSLLGSTSFCLLWENDGSSQGQGWDILASTGAF